MELFLKSLNAAVGYTIVPPDQLPEKCPECDGDRRGVWCSVGCTTLGSWRECPACHGSGVLKKE